MTDADIADSAVLKSTGADWATWMARIKPHHDLDHRSRVKAVVAEHPDLTPWWAQMVTVEYERRSGIRVVGQASTGDYQVTCSKTMPWSREECLERVLSTPFLAGADWTPGASWEVDGCQVEVRRVDDNMVRWFWNDGEGKSTVEIDFWPNKSGEKMQIRISHYQLANPAARDMYRAKWKQALEMICSAD